MQPDRHKNPDAIVTGPKPEGLEPGFVQLSRPILWACIGCLVFMVCLFYLPVLRNGFVNWDDMDVIAENPHIRSLNLANLRWMFTTFHADNWVPLTWLSLALNYRMGGLQPGVFHFTNVALHALNTALVFLTCVKVIRLIRGESAFPMSAVIPTALVTALLFGLHPIHVESVAWATERKDVLYSFFYLSGILLYLDYVSSRLKNKLKLYGCLGLYLLALMSKPMAVTLPLAFLILDYWPLDRFPSERLKPLVEKIPFFILALVFGCLAVASHEDTISSTAPTAQVYWMMNAFRSLIFYLFKMALPLNLVPLVPFPRVMDTYYQIQNLLAALLVVIAVMACYRTRKTAPYWGAAGLFYLLTLLPVLGILQTGSQAAADRYTYFPSLSVFFLFSAGMACWLSNCRFFLPLFIVALTCLLGFGTVRQIGLWKNSETLWESVVRAYPADSALAYTYLGGTYTEEKRWNDALGAFQQALAIPPPMAAAHLGYGRLLLYFGKVDQAIQEFNTAIAIDPNQVRPHESLWSVYERLGKHPEAISQIQTAIQMEPNDAGFFCDLGVSFSILKRYPEAEKAFQKAHELDPDSSLCVVNLATVQVFEGRASEAMSLYQQEISEGNRIPLYYLKMADIFLDQRKTDQALQALQTASQLNPQEPKLLQQIGEDYDRAGQKAIAQSFYERVRSLTGTKPPQGN